MSEVLVNAINNIIDKHNQTVDILKDMRKTVDVLQNTTTTLLEILIDNGITTTKEFDKIYEIVVKSREEMEK